jgi:hypothetical protein
MTIYPNFNVAAGEIRGDFPILGRKVQGNRWQGISIEGKPDMQTVEMFNTSLTVPMRHSNILELQEDTACNMPWAEQHFQERVAGIPFNPGETWRTWPWGNSADKFRDAHGRFNHNYMERYWPRYAGFGERTTAEHAADDTPMNTGIRGVYGDLDDVVTLLAEDPYTRQAYLPVWFPEDTGIGDNGRKPCTLGYHFLVRNDRMHITYYIRSCDFVRHFRDDIYLTARLVWWVLQRLNEDHDHHFWSGVKPGMFVMHIASLHMFVNDYIAMFGKEPQ